MPADTVNAIVPQIIKRGRPERPGIGIQAASEELAARLGVQGVIVVNVIEGGPAEKAGLIGVDQTRQRLGDVIVAVNGTPVRTVSELAQQLAKSGINKEVTLTVERQGQRRDVRLTIIDIG